MRRIVVFALLAALALSLTDWRGTPVIGATDVGVTTPRIPGVALDAPLTAKPQVIASGWIEQRVKSRLRLGSAVLVGLSVLLLVVMASLHRVSSEGLPTFWRRSRATLRAPPVLRLS